MSIFPTSLIFSQVYFGILKPRRVSNTDLFAMFSKKVLLRERKRHTARHVSNTPAVLSLGGEPSCSDVSVTLGSPSPILTLDLTWMRGTPGYPCPDLGPNLDEGVPPTHADLGPDLERTWDQWKYNGMEMGYPPGEQIDTCEDSIFPILRMRAVMMHLEKRVLCRRKLEGLNTNGHTFHRGHLWFILVS